MAARAIRRAGAVLEELARPPHGLRLADLIDALAINKSTLHSILAELLELGLVQRDASTRRYRIGPTMLRHARALVPSTPLVDVARAELTALARDTGLGVDLIGRLDDDCLVIDRRLAGADDAPDDAKQTWPTVGALFPFEAPVCTCFVAWAPADEQRSWMRRGSWSHDDEDDELLRGLLDDIRRFGYDYGARSDFRARAMRIITRLPDDPTDEDIRSAILSLRDDLCAHSEATNGNEAVRAAPGSLTAPIFDADERVAFDVHAPRLPRGPRRRPAARVHRAVAGRRRQGQPRRRWPAPRGVRARARRVARHLSARRADGAEAGAVNQRRASPLGGPGCSTGSVYPFGASRPLNTSSSAARNAGPSNVGPVDRYAGSPAFCASTTSAISRSSASTSARSTTPWCSQLATCWLEMRKVARSSMSATSCASSTA